MNTKNRRMLVMALMVVSVLILFGAISYAYFTTQTEEKKQQVDLNTATLALRFADNDNGVKAEMKFGETVTKKFLIENTGTAEASLSIDWYNLVNTYMDGSLTYSLVYSETEDGEYEEIRPKSSVPVSDEMIHQTLEGEVSVPAGKTYYYNLYITLNNLSDSDQSRDVEAKFTTMFNVGQPIKYRYYSLRINPNGGEYESQTGVSEYLLKNGETKDITNPTRTGYTFGGWDIKSLTSTMDENTFTMGIGDTELVARWMPNKYTLMIDANGGEYSGEISSEMDYGSSIGLTTPTREGYTFTGWTKSAGSLEDNTFTMSEARDATLTANWQINNYKYIVYHHQMNVSGSGYTLVGADTDEGEAQFNSTVTPGVKTYTGFTSPAQKSLTIKAETVYPPVLNKVDYNYERNQYTLTIDPAGGTYSGTTPLTMYYGATTTLSIPTKTGYNFSKWTATSGTVSGNDFTIGNSDATVTASYTAKTFSVTFNPNGGSTTTASKTVTYDSTYGTLPIPTYTGYEFLGWFTASSGGTEVTANTKVGITANQTLFAHWKEKYSVETTIAKLNITSKGTVSDFDTPATTAATSGVYQMVDDYGTSYYYRGIVTSNYVKFAGFYWRIIRVNGDGSLRIIYNGRVAHTNGENHADVFINTEQKYNNYYDDNKYEGWMYGPSSTIGSTTKEEAQANTADSDIKRVVDSWYKTNIVDKGYSSAVSDILFCNDRSTPGRSATGYSYDTGLGYGSNWTAFGAIARTGVWNSSSTKSSPKFKCPQKNDAFTVNDTSKGNGALTYPVGLITADEVLAAGSGKYGAVNRSYYLYRPNKWYWTLSPFTFSASEASIFIVSDGGYLGYYSLNNNKGAVAPVINLSAEYVSNMIGTGTMTDPYRASDVTV